MHTPIKILSLLVLLNVTYLHGMEVEIPSKKRSHSLDELTSSSDIILMEVEEQKDDAYKDPRLLLGLPDDIFTTILSYSLPKDDLDYAIMHLVSLGLTCKKFEHFRMPEQIKSILSPNQEKLDLSLHCNCNYLFNNPHAQPYVQLLLAMGADVNSKSEYGNTCLHFINNAELAQFLISSGINMDHQNKSDGTALHWAIELNHIEIVEVLLKNGANMYLKDKMGRIPSHYACVFSRKKMLKLFIQYGLDTSIEYNFNNRKATLIEWVTDPRYEDIYELITGEKLPKEAEVKSTSELLYETTSYVYNLITTPLQHLSSLMG